MNLRTEPISAFMVRLAGARVQCADQLILLILARSGNHALPPPGHPGRADSRVEVDIGLVGIEHLTVRAAIDQGFGDHFQALQFVLVANAQRRSRSAITESEALEPSPHRGGMDLRTCGPVRRCNSIANNSELQRPLR